MNLNADQGLELLYVRIEHIFDLVCTNGMTKRKSASLPLRRIVARLNAARGTIDPLVTKYRDKIYAEYENYRLSVFVWQTFKRPFDNFRASLAGIDSPPPFLRQRGNPFGDFNSLPKLLCAEGVVSPATFYAVRYSKIRRMTISTFW